MNYTENHHLPQWVESDRIMMRDFNAAMLCIEAGLSQGDRVKTAAGGLCRDAYRREVQMRLHHGVGGTMDAMWVNPLASRTDAGGDGHGWNGRYGVWLGDGLLPTLEGIAKTAKEESFIRLGSVDDIFKASTTFTSNGYGMLEYVTVWYTEYTNSPKDNFTHTIRLYRADTGALVKEAGPFTYDHRTFIQHKTDFPLEANVPYRLEMTMERGPYMGRMGFLLATGEYQDTSNSSLVIGKRAVADTISKNLIVPGQAGSAVGIVRWKGEGTLDMKLGKCVGSVTRTRDGINALGQACRETEFLLDGLTAGAAALTLRMNRGDGDLQVFDYGVIWQ